MKIELTNIWKIDNVLVIAKSIDEAILIYRTYNGNITIHRIELITDSYNNRTFLKHIVFENSPQKIELKLVK